MSSSPDVIVRRQGRIGRLTLNRPHALNAITLDMVHVLGAALDGWREDPAVHAVVIEGAGNKAFCAGGDVRALRDSVLRGGEAAAAEVERFFRDEYALDLAIATYPKPYVAIVDGICMGGGVGVSVHGAYRATSEKAVFAMPETAIGLFPDVGGTFTLPRLRGEVGMWMGLTGARLGGADAVWAGLATHYVPSARLATLADELAEHGLAALAAAAEAAPATLPKRIEAINRCFGAPSVPAVLARLDAEGGDGGWAREQAAAIRRLSPSATLLTFDLLRRGGALTLPRCFDAELDAMLRALRRPDFAEGVRAMVVDKDRAPRWSPARLEDVDARALAAAPG